MRIMCIFAGPVPIDDVRNTRIFARLTGRGTQYLVYSMNYATTSEMAMILPLPVGSHDETTTVRFLALDECPNFFDAMYRGFASHPSNQVLMSLSDPEEEMRSLLAVHQVGAYEATFVPTLADFDRLDARFTLSEAIWQQLPLYHDYGFAVFKLRVPASQQAEEAHPMAFEFVTRFTDTLFFPTVHIHDGQVHDVGNFDHRLFYQSESVMPPKHADFYQGQPVNLLECYHRIKNAGQKFDWNAVGVQGVEHAMGKARDFMDMEGTHDIIDGEQKCHLLLMDGLMPNQDTLLK